ncbi:DUF1064 domain-containing protein [Vandammella animalimorsus]|nr:DUF1064 domain-containing protein [Vandammella animalimorsus]
MFVRMTADQWAAAQRRNAQAGAPRARRGVHQKYGNQRVTTEAGERFDSKAEYRHWLHLRVLEQAGRIRDLRRQVAFELAPAVVLGGRRKPALRYVADFVYLDEAGRQVVEDVKGAVTPVWQIKRHLMAAVHGIEVKEVRA